MVPFHLAIPVDDLESARAFYLNVFGCEEGRTSESWVDLNFFGHQLVLHYVDKRAARLPPNPVDGQRVPVPHFGVVLSWTEWHELAERLRDTVSFVIEPTVRFAGHPGEQATMFFLDPCGNAIEIKSMRNPEALFQPGALPAE